MRFETIENLHGGEKVGADLFDLNDRMVVGKGSTLTAAIIRKLDVLGFSGLYIDDALSADIEVKHVVSPKLKNAARKCIQDGDIDSAINYATNIVDDILKNGIVALDMHELKNYDDFIYSHSVNVAILACLVGMGMNLQQSELDDLTIAGLLHDLGKYQLPKELVNKADKLTKEEYEKMQTHPNISYGLIFDRMDISSTAKDAVLHHHENEDGSGYPSGLTGDKLTVITKILHVVDNYEALVSERPYKTGYTPWEAAEYLMGGCGIMFDKRVVDTFVKVVPLYQKGQSIVLSTGERAIVLDNTGSNNLRPVIRYIDSMETVDLASREYMNLAFYTGDEWEKKQRLEYEFQRNRMESGKKRIFVVDDMKMNRILLTGILQDKYDLEFAESGEEAIQFIKRDKYFDLILMDIDMPKMSGLDAAKEINSITNSSIPVLFVSALHDIQTVIKCREIGAAGYISRPYKAVFVISEIERVVS